MWLELLLLICCLYTGGTWFPVAGTAVLFGAGLVLLPLLLPSLPGPEWLTGRKTALCLAVETALLLLLLLVCVLSYGGTWFPGAAMGCVFGLSLIFVPVFLRQLPLPPFFRDKKLTLYLAVETALFLLLLLVCQLAYGGDWFPVAAVSVLFGLGLLFLPVVLCQLPLGPLEDPQGPALLRRGDGPALRHPGRLGLDRRRGMVLPPGRPPGSDRPGPALGPPGDHPLPAGEQVVQGLPLLRLDGAVAVAGPLVRGRRSWPSTAG